MNDFGYVAKVIDEVTAGLNQYVEDDEEELADKVDSLPVPQKAGKKVSFGSIVDLTMEGKQP